MRLLEVHSNYRIIETINAILTIKHLYPEFYGYVYYTDNDTIFYRVFSFERKDRKIKFDLKNEKAIGYYNTSKRPTDSVSFSFIFQNLYTRLTK